jgi:UTP--glucose-1-phosphate uridylyltransferase
MLPAAKAVPKELLPILDRPCVQHVMEEAAAAGLTEALLITSRYKRAIEDHFDRDGELEARLAAAGKQKLIASVTELAAKIKIFSVRQPEMRGLGHAVLQARAFCANEPFLCMLGDAVFSSEPGVQGPSAQLCAAYAELKTSLIGLEEVAPDRVDRYGIVGGTMIRPGLIRIEKLVEKPRPADAPSRLAVAARYVLTPAIFECLDQTSPGSGGEIQLTDALQRLLAREPIYGVVLNSRRHDIGDLVGWLKTNLLFAAADANLWKQIEPMIRTLLKS